MAPVKTRLVLGLAIAAGGCSSISLSALHDPLYRASPHTSTITARASDSEKGVSEIRIDAIEGELTACTENGGLPSLIPCRIHAVSRTRVCTFANETGPVSCALGLPLGDRRLITYTTSARNGAGRTTSTGAITYAAGAPLTQTQFMSFFTIPWETARPVWWHTDTPSGSGADDRIDVGFFPDADFGTNYQAFTSGMQTVSLGAFFNDTDQFAATYRIWKNSFNLWAGPPGADGEEGCSRSLTGSASTIAGVTEGDVILHQNAFRDCAAISQGGAGTTQIGLSDAAWVFVHESGHFLHGLGDEYVGGGNWSVSDPANVYDSKASCEAAAATLSINPSFCAQIGTTGTWRMDDGSPTTMEDRVLTSDWRTASGIALSRRFTRCGSGACY
jgi:hypothetical protein